MNKWWGKLVWLIFLMIFTLGACSGRASQQGNGGDVEINLSSGSSGVGKTVIVLTVTDSQGQPVSDADVVAKGDMTHAGMVPVLGEGTTGAAGKVEIPWEWTMAGEWVVTADVTLPDGTTATRRFEQLQIEGGGQMEMEMEMEQDQMMMVGDLAISQTAANLALPSDTGAVYLTIANLGEGPDTLNSAAINGCDIVEIHESSMIDGVMSMRPVEGGQILIPAGATIQLAQGGIHLMCIGKGSFAVGDMVTVTLDFASAGSIDLMVPVVDPAMIGSMDEMDHGEMEDGEMESDG